MTDLLSRFDSSYNTGVARGFTGPSLSERQNVPPDKARRLVERFEWHYTPKHGSWLDMAESELTVLASQCLDRRIPDVYESNPEAVGIGSNRGQAHSRSMRFKSSISSDNVPSAVTRP
jgi:hypothetical protein